MFHISQAYEYSKFRLFVSECLTYLTNFTVNFLEYVDIEGRSNYIKDFF